MTTLLRNGETPESILEKILGGLDMHITDRRDVRFRCDCSRERVTGALIAMGSKELRSMIADGEPVELNCHFCNTNYTFSVEELRSVLEMAQKKGR